MSSGKAYLTGFLTRKSNMDKRTINNIDYSESNRRVSDRRLRTDEVLNKLEAVIDQLASGNMLLDKVTSHPQTLARPMKAG